MVRIKFTKNLTLKIVFIIIFILFAIFISVEARENEFIRRSINDYGYLGIFIISLISGFNLVVPIPAITFLPAFVESGLNEYWIILLITAGMATADSIAFFIGKTGKQIALSGAQKGLLNKLEGIRQRSHGIPIVLLFLFAAFAPLPNEVILIPIAILGYRFITILPVIFLGNFIFNILVGAGILNLSRIF